MLHMQPYLEGVHALLRGQCAQLHADNPDTWCKVLGCLQACGELLHAIAIPIPVALAGPSSSRATSRSTS
jgi:hypothetical protein